MWPHKPRPIIYLYSYICKKTGVVLETRRIQSQYWWAKQAGDICENKHSSYEYNTRYDGVLNGN